MKSSSRRVCAFFLAAHAFVARPLHAQETTDANALIEHGLDLREHGHDDEALLVFTRAYALAPSPRAAAQIGLAEQALGQWVAADARLREALAATDDPWIRDRRPAITLALSTVATHLCLLEIRGDAPGAVVLLDGIQIGILPLRDPVRVEAGTRTLEIRAPGYYPISRPVVLSPGGIARETISLAPLPPPPVALSTPPMQAAPIATTSTRGETQRTLAWGGLAVTGGLLAFGIVSAVEHGARVSDYDGDPSCPGNGAADQSAACTHRLSLVSTWKALTIVGFAGAGAFAAASVTLFVTAPKASSNEVACAVGLGSLACGATF